MIKNKIKYILYRLGMRGTIPAHYINHIPVTESGECLINLLDDDRFSFDRAVAARGGFWVRDTVAQMLGWAAAKLPAGFRLHLVHGLRPMGHQWAMWLTHREKLGQEYPHLSHDALDRMARAMVACPKHGYGPHQTGGAIDVTIVDASGRPLDMGTAILTLNQQSRTRTPQISHMARKNRQLLINVMTAAGFNNYPAEWWHWSYGDRMWAAYQNKKFAIYGPISCADYVLSDQEHQILADYHIHI